jgi:hypothetical protein
MAKSAKHLEIIPERLDGKTLLRQGSSQGESEVAAVNARRQGIYNLPLVARIIDDLPQGRERYNLPSLPKLSGQGFNTDAA